MEAVQIIMGSIGLIVGSLTAGILICWIPWSACKVVRHPAWGPIVVAIPVLLALTGRLPHSEFLVMTLIFACVAAVPFCIEGRAWRARMLERDSIGAPEPGHAVVISDIAPVPDSYQRYPAIAGCICDARKPDREELKKVACRILTEAYFDKSPRTSFAKRRAVLRAAKIALVGVVDPKAGIEQHQI